MRSRRLRIWSFGATGILAIGIMTASAGSATAQGLFDFLFNAFRRPAALPNSYADPAARDAVPDRPHQRMRSSSGSSSGGASSGSVSYCVRLCDGRHFPINYRADVTPVETCNAFCPATKTKVFSGSSIDEATANDGKAYKDLPAAFTYREKVVSDCTCNGKEPFGLAQIDVKNDPTLRPGDIVATRDGLMTASGSGSRVAFTPIKGELRRKLLAVKVVPARTGRTNVATSGDIRIETNRKEPNATKPSDTTGLVARPSARPSESSSRATTEGRASD